MKRAWWLAALWALGCGKASPRIQPEPGPAAQGPAAQARPRASDPEGQARPRASEESAMKGERLEFRGIFFGKPPLKELSFDVTLRNEESEPRWLIVPQTLPYEGKREPAPGQGDEVEVQIFQLDASNRLFEGIAGHLWAIKLAPGAQITLRKLAIRAWWENIPGEVGVEVISARSLHFGDLPAEGLAQGEALSPGGDLEAPGGAGDRRALSFWHPAPGKPAPISFDVAGRRTLRAPIVRR